MTIPPVRAAIRNRRLLLTILATLAFDIAEWALWIGVLVYAYDRGGATAAGFAAVGLLVPSALAAPIAGVMADGPRPERILMLGYAAEAVALLGTTVAVVLEAPLVVVIPLTALALAALTFARPSTAVVVPGLVSTPGELTAANLLGGWCDGASVFSGPLIAAGLLALDGPRSVFAFCAGLCVLAAIATIPLGRSSVPASIFDDPSLTTVRHTRRALASLVACLRSLATRPASLLLLIVLGAQYVLVGALDLLYVILAVDLLDLGDAGTGYLSAAFGAGSLFGVLIATLLVARRHLAPVLLVCLCAIAASMLLLGAVTTIATAFVLIPIAGLSRAVLDLTGRMLMQRAAPQDALASVFAALEALACIGMAVGSILAQILVTHASEHAAIIGIGVFFGVLVLVASMSHLVAVDAAADVPVVTIRLLRSIPLFAPLNGPALEALARAATTSEVAAGDTIISEGDVGERYYAIVSGRFAVNLRGHELRTMSRGEGFGEVALVADIPRTATVVAVTEGTLLEIDRGPFLTAVTGHDASSRVAWQTTRTIEAQLASAGASGAAEAI